MPAAQRLRKSVEIVRACDDYFRSNDVILRKCQCKSRGGVFHADPQDNNLLLIQYGCSRLINRTARSASLTPAGRMYWDACVQLLTHLAAVEKDFASAAKEPTGTLRIASANSFAVSELPRVLSAYHSIEPKVPLEVSIIENTGVDENRRLVPTAARSFNDFVLSHYRVQASESDAEISVNRSVELHRLVFRSRGGL